MEMLTGRSDAQFKSQLNLLNQFQSAQ